MAFEYFAEAELTALPQMSEEKYTSARKSAAHDYIVGIIERVVGTSFVARTVTDEVHDGGRYEIPLRVRFPQSITSATEDGVAVTDDLRVRGGVLRRFAGASTFTPTLWTFGVGNVSVTYEAGYSSAVPDDIKEAALKGARAHLLSTNSNATVDERRTSMNTELGTINFIVAGENNPTGYPEVDSVILGWRNDLRYPMAL